MAKTRTAGTSHVHTVRTRDGGTKTLKLTRKLAIHAFCTECLGWEDHPSDCTARMCPLYPFRNLTLKTRNSYKKKVVPF